MTNYNDYEDLRRHLEYVFNPEQAQLLAEILMKSREQTAITSATETPSLDELRRKLKTFNRSIIIVVFLEAVALPIGGILVNELIHDKNFAWFDVYLLSMWCFLIVGSSVALVDLASRRNKLKRRIGPTSICN